MFEKSCLFGLHN